MAQREAASQAVLETHITLRQHQVTAMCCFNGGGKSPKVGCGNGISLMEKDIAIPSGEGKASHITQHILCVEDHECRAQGANVPFNTPSWLPTVCPGAWDSEMEMQAHIWLVRQTLPHRSSQLTHRHGG